MSRLQTLPAAVIGALLASALPCAAQPPAKRELPAETDAVFKNLKQIGLGFHVYHDAHGKLPPPAVTDAKGRKLLSWRVALLPYIEQKALYEQFKIDEPWDSEHNKKLIAQMPKLFADPRVKAPAGQTYYKMSAGRDALGGGKAKEFKEISDGLSNTLLAVAGADPIEWTKPDDFEIDFTKPLPDFSKPFPRVFAVFGDGSARAYDAAKWRANPKIVKEMITPNGGEAIDDAPLFGK